MKPSMPSHRTPRPGEPGATAAGPTSIPAMPDKPCESGTQAEQLAEALSAWMDGEALPAGVDEAALLQWLLHDEQAQATWQRWQTQADCLRTAGLHAWLVDKGAGDGESKMPLQVGTGRQRSRVDEVGSVAWNARLGQRLAQQEQPWAQTRAGSDEEAKAVRTAQPVGASPFAARALPVGAAGAAYEQPFAQTVAAVTSPAASQAMRIKAEAANDPVWRWKLAAGFASVAAVGVTLWSLLGQPAVPFMNPPLNGALLAVQTPSGANPQGVMNQSHVALAEAQAPTQLASADTASATVDDPYAEALLQAHSQLGDNLLMQDVSLMEQDESF